MSSGNTPETSCDGRDSDCDDTSDEGCGCVDGDERNCYGGPEGSENVGLCSGGRQRCIDGLWSECNADTIPSPDRCDGLDNDCDGKTDEDDPAAGSVCTSDARGRCAVGIALCEEGALRCVGAVEPQTETCDGLDNDCDGATDEVFRVDGDGPFVSDEHCGACNQPCADTIPGAEEERCANMDDGPRCIVVTCERGFYSSGPTSCSPAQASPCSSCQTDADCPTPGDACLQLSGSRVCGSDCSTDNLHGTPPGVCPAGFQCSDITVGGKELSQCTPMSGSCDCRDDNASETRPCTISNEQGTCSGQQVCDPANGWSMCDAPSPSTEVCNGRDDDCNGEADDGIEGVGIACESGRPGVCLPGRRACDGESGTMVCVPLVAPADDEVCDNGLDDDCDGYWDDGCCTHSPCQAGAPLTATCSECTQRVCEAAPACCDQAFNASCAEIARTMCPDLCEQDATEG